MGSSEHTQPLAGLVSEEAERLYGRLLTAGWLEIGTDVSEESVASGAARELLDARVAYNSPLNDGRLRPVRQAAALQLLLSTRNKEITAKQQQIATGWQLLDEILSVAATGNLPNGSDDCHLVEVVSGLETVHKISIDLQHSVRRELLGLALNTSTLTGLAEEQLVTPPEPIVTKGGRFRMIYNGAFAAHKVGARLIELSVAGGEEARIRAQLPLKMLHVDDTVALVALTGTGIDGSLVVHSPHLLAALREWFELLWNDPATTPVQGTNDEGLSSAQRHVMRLMSSGLSDEAIAKASGMSVRTVRRHITAIMESLGVMSRFAAGATAAKRGWI